MADPSEKELGPDRKLDPGFLRKAKNFTIAVSKHIGDGMKELDEEAYQERVETCKACPSFNPVKKNCRERDCGCNIYKKARWRSESCPLGKWKPQENTNTDSKVE